MLARRGFLAALAACTLNAARVGAQSPAALVPVRIASAPDEDIIGALWGIAGGAFRQAGLDVAVTRANNGAAVAAAVIGGAVDIGKSSLVALIVAHSRGVPFELIAPGAVYDSSAPNTGLIVAKDSPITSAKDLDGKTLSVAALDDLNTLSIEAWTDRHGGDSASLHFVELPVTAAPEAVASGRVVAAVATSPTLARALAAGHVRLLGHPLDAISPHFAFSAYFATADYVTKNADVVARFTRALAESAAYVNTHHAATIDVLATFTGVDPKVIAANPRVTLGTAFEPNLLQPLIDTAAKYHAIPAAFDARELIDPSLPGRF